MWQVCFAMLGIAFMLQHFLIVRLYKQLNAITNAAAAFLEVQPRG